jgi:hypothetical protein
LARVSPTSFAWRIRPDPTSTAVSQPLLLQSVSITLAVILQGSSLSGPQYTFSG